MPWRVAAAAKVFSLRSLNGGRAAWQKPRDARRKRQAKCRKFASPAATRKKKNRNRSTRRYRAPPLLRPFPHCRPMRKKHHREGFPPSHCRPQSNQQRPRAPAASQRPVGSPHAQQPQPRPPSLIIRELRAATPAWPHGTREHRRDGPSVDPAPVQPSAPSSAPPRILLR